MLEMGSLYRVNPQVNRPHWPGLKTADLSLKETSFWCRTLRGVFNAQ